MELSCEWLQLLRAAPSKRRCSRKVASEADSYQNQYIRSGKRCSVTAPKDAIVASNKLRETAEARKNFAGERGTRTLDLGIISAVLVQAVDYIHVFNAFGPVCRLVILHLL